MFGLVVTLLIIALIARILGFGGIAGAAMGFCENPLLVVSMVFGAGALADRSERSAGLPSYSQQQTNRRAVGRVYGPVAEFGTVTALSASRVSGEEWDLMQLLNYSTLRGRHPYNPTIHFSN
jgi:uncharacterized membrane protein YtjA (UPF0391 family)